MGESKIFKNLTNNIDINNAIKDLLPKKIKIDNIVFLCIGTDRCTGDSLGPMIGTKLKSLGYTNVIGTIEEPAHALNLVEKINSIPKDKFIIAIDACLGDQESISTVSVANKPIKPGAAVKKELPKVGNVGIKGIVNIGGFHEMLVLSNTRLHVVIELADKITNSISSAIPHKELKKQNSIVQKIQKYVG